MQEKAVSLDLGKIRALIGFVNKETAEALIELIELGTKGLRAMKALAGVCEAFGLDLAALTEPAAPTIPVFGRPGPSSSSSRWSEATSSVDAG